MSDKKSRMAGDKLANAYTGEDEYGKWGDTWDNEAEQQQLKAAGKYEKGSDYAKQFADMKENISSRVDDEDGWRQLSIDGSLKDPTKYADLVNDWSNAGFDVRAIDMGDGFHSSNIAVRIANGDGTGVVDPVKPDSDPETTNPPPSEPAPVSSGPTQTINNGTPGYSGPMPEDYKYGSFQQQNNIQDNDINSTVTGSNNTTNITQDNSNSFVGGNSYAGDAQMFTNDYIKKFMRRFS